MSSAARSRDHEQRDAGAPRACRHALPDGAAGEPAPRDGRLGRGHHHHGPRVGQPLRARERRARDVRGERQDRLRRAGHGRVGPDAARTSRRATQRAKDAMAALEGKKQVASRRKLGTDFTVSIEGRPSLELSPKKRRGQMMGPLPLWAEVAFAAVEDFTHGTAVVDGVMLGIGLPGQVKEPIRWTIEGGKCVKIEGGEEADRLRKVIDGVEGATVIGEFAFGVERQGALRHALREGPCRHRPPRARRQPQRLPRRPEPLGAAPRRRLPRRHDVDRRRRHVHPARRRVGRCDSHGRRGSRAGRRRPDRSAWRQLVAHADHRRQRRGQRELARLLGVRAGHRSSGPSRTRSRRSHTSSRAPASCGSTTVRSRSARARPCTSPRGSGTPSRTRASRTS